MSPIFPYKCLPKKMKKLADKFIPFQHAHRINHDKIGLINATILNRIILLDPDAAQYLAGLPEGPLLFTQTIPSTLPSYNLVYLASERGLFSVIAALIKTLPPDKIMRLLSTPETDGFRPADIAADKGHASVIAAMIEKLPPDKAMRLLSTPDPGGFRPADIAAYKGHASVIAAMIENLSEENALTLLCRNNANGVNPVHIAADKGHASVIAAMIKKLPRDKIMTLLSTPDADGYNPADIAAKDGHASVIAAMIEKLTPDKAVRLLTTPNRNHLSPFDYAVQRNQISVIDEIAKLPNNKGIILLKTIGVDKLSSFPSVNIKKCAANILLDALKDEISKRHAKGTLVIKNADEHITAATESSLGMAHSCTKMDGIIAYLKDQLNNIQTKGALGPPLPLVSKPLPQVELKGRRDGPDAPAATAGAGRPRAPTTTAGAVRPRAPTATAGAVRPRAPATTAGAGRPRAPAATAGAGRPRAPAATAGQSLSVSDITFTSHPPEDRSKKTPAPHGRGRTIKAHNSTTPESLVDPIDGNQSLSHHAIDSFKKMKQCLQDMKNEDGEKSLTSSPRPDN